MPGSITNFGAAQLQSALFGGGTVAAPATWYVGLSQYPADPGGTIVEPGGGGYARVAVANTRGNFAVTPSNGPEAGVTTNLGTITFPTPTGPWGPVLSMFLADASGNVWYASDLAVPRAPTAGSTAPTIAPGALFVSHA